MTRRHALVAGLALFVVSPLAVLVRLGWDPLADTDRTVDVRAHGVVLHHDAVLALSRWLTHLGDPWLVTALSLAAAVGCWLAGRRVDAVYLLAVRAGAVVLGIGMKEAMARARPDLAQPVAHAGGYSFPSGHAFGAAATYLSLALVASRARPAVAPLAVTTAILVALVVGTTRVMLGVHFPSDVAAGLVLGWAIALLARSAEPSPRDPTQP